MTSVSTANVSSDHSLLDLKLQLEYLDEPPYSINNFHIIQFLQSSKDSNSNNKNIRNDKESQKQRHSLLSSSSSLLDENIHNLEFLNFATLYIDLQKRAQISQQILEVLENGDNSLSSSSLSSSFSSSSTITTTSTSASPLHSYIYAYATLLQCSTKTSTNHNEQVVYLLNRAEYKLRNAITSCEMNRELALDFVLQSELHFLLARILFELSFPRSDELERESAVMAAMSQPLVGMKSSVNSPSPSQPSSIISSPIQIGSNNSPKETLSAPGVIGSYYGSSVGMSHSLSSENFMALSLDSPLRNSTYGSPNSSSNPNLKQGSGSPSFSPRGNSSQKAAQQAQQQVDSIFQDICLHMDSAIKFYEKSTVKRKKKVDEPIQEEPTPVDITQESRRAYMNMCFGDVLTQWSVRRKQRWAALCSRAQEKYNICIKICIEKILPSLNREKVVCVNTRGVEQFNDNQCIYSPLHHQCLYKYSVLLLYWVRRKREHTTIYSGDSSSGDVNLASFDYDSTMVAVDSIGEIETNYSEIRPNTFEATSPPNSTPENSKGVPRHAQSIFKNSVATDAEKLCKACVKLWECVCELEERKSKAFQVIPENTINPHYYFRLSNSIYEYALLLIPSASVLSFNDYLETYDNLEGERTRTTSRSEVLSSSLSWHDMLFKDRMLNDKKDLLRENNRKVISDQSSKTVILDENNKDDLRLRYSLIYSDQIGEINIRTILTREALMEKAIEAIDKCISLTSKTNTDLLMFHSQLYFEMGALKTTSITSSSESHIVNTIKQHDKKRTQKTEVENLSETMLDENRQRMLGEVDELFTLSIVSLNKVLEAKPAHMVAMAVLGEVYFFWSRAKFGKESDKHIQNAIEIWTRLLNYPQLTLPFNITLDHISRMIYFALEIRKGIIICDGMGLKQGKLRKSWTERYFLLTIEYFGYFQIKTTKSLKKKKMKNTIPSDTIEYVKQNTEDKFTSNKNYPFCLEVVCKKRTFYVCYNSQEELDRWDAAFEYVILMNQIMSGTAQGNKFSTRPSESK